MSSVQSPHGKRLHRSISIRTKDGAETMYCGLLIRHHDLKRNWRQPDCKACKRRGA